MTVRATSWAMRAPVETAKQRLVLIMLAECCGGVHEFDPNGTYQEEFAEVDLEILERACVMPPSEVSGTISTLVEQGKLSTVLKKDGRWVVKMEIE
jgi:hypothetical protein